MRNDNNKDNLLFELANAMPERDNHLPAMALRCLAQHGYTSLTEVEAAVDCELLALDGIGLERLGAIRRLTQADWQPPSRQAVRTAMRLLSSAQLALRFWRVEDLEAALTGGNPIAAEDKPVETKLSMTAFAAAVREALPHHESGQLVQIVQRAAMLTSHGRKPRQEARGNP